MNKKHAFTQDELIELAYLQKVIKDKGKRNFIRFIGSLEIDTNYQDAKRVATGRYQVYRTARDSATMELDFEVSYVIRHLDPDEVKWKKY